MTRSEHNAHHSAIIDQFSRQARGFATSPELHMDDVLNLMVGAAHLKPNDRAIDLACGPGSVACALAKHAAHVVGLDATQAMLDQARTLAKTRGLTNVEWAEGDIYAAPYPSASFDVVTCRFAFHHFERPHDAFAEMARLVKPGGRIVLCDGLASNDVDKARAFNAMERRRDPSTVEFRTLNYLSRLFVEAGFGEPATKRFQVPYLAADLVAASFPEDNDRAGLLALIEKSVENDTLGMGAHKTTDGVRIAYAAAVLDVVKPSS